MGTSKRTIRDCCESCEQVRAIVYSDGTTSKCVHRLSPAVHA